MASRRAHDDADPSLERRLTTSGHLARLEESRGQQGAWTLYVDGTPQSHVDLEHPDRMAAVAPARAHVRVGPAAKRERDSA